MNQDTILGIIREALIITAMISSPILACILIIGLIVAMFQAMTQINEVTLSFVPKLIMITVIVMVAGHWMLGILERYSIDLVEHIPYLIGVR